MKGLWRFPGGVKLAGNKALSNGASIRTLPEPRWVTLPLQQHIGAAAEPVVRVGERVDKGQLVAAPASFVSAGVHASVSGTVVGIARHRMPHPSGIAEMCVVIENDGEQRWSPQLHCHPEIDVLSGEALREIVRAAGIVGLGGAVFPAAAKLNPSRAIDTLVVNGVECEPYISCDDMLMRERAEEVIRGSLLLRHMVSAARCLIAVEDNKPAALASLRSALAAIKPDAGPLAAAVIEVVSVPTVFPTGGEKQLLKVLTGREVPVGGLPYEVGAVCMNVGTTVAVHDAVYRRRPLVSRIVTVTGDGVRDPGNFEVPLGTSIADLLAAAGGTSAAAYDLVMGGPMMGQRLPGADVMVVKGTNCVLVRSAGPPPEPAMPCIRCGACADACPMKLLPQQLYWHARGRQFDRLAHYSLPSCIECGCCAVVCPSQIPLVSYFRFAKSEIRDQDLRRQRASESRTRNEQRTERLEAQKREQDARKAQRKAGRRKRSAVAQGRPENQAAGLQDEGMGDAP